MLKIFFGFLPWILYFVLVGTTNKQHEIAITAALLTTLIIDFQEIKKGFILTWGTLVFFSGLLIATFIFPSEWLEAHASLLANSGLAFIACFSLVINKPFTLQYAKEKVAKEFWKTTLFIRINQIITAVWASSFLVSVGLSVLQLYSLRLDNWMLQTLSYAPSLFAIWFTKIFPEWYKTYHIHRVIDQSEQSLKNNPFLKENFKPITDELTLDDLPVIGCLPGDLLGIYMRNGPNPACSPFSYTCPFDGDGMLHAIYFKNGKVSYKNRFVKTDQLQTEQRLGKAISGGVELPLIRDMQLLTPSDSKQKSFKHVQLDDRSVEFPRINDNFNSKEYRYIYLSTNVSAQNNSDIFNALIKYDLKTGSSVMHDFVSHKGLHGSWMPGIW